MTPMQPPANSNSVIILVILLIALPLVGTIIMDYFRANPLRIWLWWKDFWAIDLYYNDKVHKDDYGDGYTGYVPNSAVSKKKPMIDRVVTVTGSAVNKPGNFLARIGAPFSQLIEAAGGINNGGKVIMGGPMMGLAQPSLDLPVIKGTSGIMVLDQASSQIPESDPCLLCGRCVDTCPMKLIPTRIATLAEYDLLDDADKLGILDCMECGTCTYICPSNRNLVHWIKFGKLGVMEARKKAKATA